MRKQNQKTRSPRTTGKIKTAILWYQFIKKNLPVIKGLQKLEKMRSILVRCNVELGKRIWNDPVFLLRLGEFNSAMIESTQGKWYMDEAMNSRQKASWKKAFFHMDNARRIGEEVYIGLCSGSRKPVSLPRHVLNQDCGEIQWADGVPLIPSINPVVILRGSDYDMGYQYAQQLIQIFGSWILHRKADRGFTSEEEKILRQWESQLQLYAPEIIEMCKGWAAGASDSGVPMKYDDVLDIWSGHLPPARNYMGKGDPGFRMPSPLCSGAAAWGSATTDGKLVVGSSGDHDPTYMVTIIAFPETGNNFIITPFSAIGDVPMVGNVWMMGHGGMNDQGLAYVHHGGDPKMVEPQQSWGYGLRKGAVIFHTLRFANTAREALDMELTFPVGDAGRSVSTAGGFFADGKYGYVLESRKNPVIIREAGVMGEKDFLFANNGAMHPDIREAGWMQPEQWNWDEHGGWYPKKFKQPSLFSARKRDSLDAINEILGLVFTNNRGRNLYVFNCLSRSHGKIDMEFMKTMFRQSGSFPPGSWKEINRIYKKTGQWGNFSTGHAGNALVTIMKPAEKIYSICVGTARRGLTPNAPNPTGGPIYGETNTFWELKLASHPKEVVEYARLKAREYIDKALEEIGKLQESDPGYDYLKVFIQSALEEFQKGITTEKTAANSEGNLAVSQWSKATREFTNAQVRALQVVQTILPPPCHTP